MSGISKKKQWKVTFASLFLSFTLAICYALILEALIHPPPRDLQGLNADDHVVHITAGSRFLTYHGTFIAMTDLKKAISFTAA